MNQKQERVQDKEILTGGYNYSDEFSVARSYPTIQYLWLYPADYKTRLRNRSNLKHNVGLEICRTRWIITGELRDTLL